MCIGDMVDCDPLVDRCCDHDSRCDTPDDGKTYKCMVF
jgi:hypothetical protein